MAILLVYLLPDFFFAFIKSIVAVIFNIQAMEFYFDNCRSINFALLCIAMKSEGSVIIIL